MSLSIPKLIFKKFKKFSHKSLRTIVMIGAVILGSGMARPHNAPLRPELLKTSLVIESAPEVSTKGAWDYFIPAWEQWQKRPADDFFISQSTHFFVRDPERRTEKEFQVPNDLIERVSFWMNVYSRYNSKIRIVHDRTDAGLIYGYIDLRPIYRENRNAPLGLLKAQMTERQIVREIKNRLEELAGVRKSTLDPNEEQRLQNFLSRRIEMKKEKLLRLARHIRTQTGQSDVFLIALNKAKDLLPHIESVFRRQGLPSGLSRIPFVESSFNAQALSKSGAMGIWQFLPETAREMIRTNDQKAWADPLKQTTSAARLFKIYRNIVQDWGLAITSYNSGVGKISRLVKTYQVKNVEELLSLESSDSLGFAGRNFYSEFLAANLVEAYKTELFENRLEPLNIDEVLKGIAAFPKESCGIY